MAIIEKVCIVGARGMLGQKLVRVCRESPGRKPVECHALDLKEIDITNALSVADVISQLRPDLLTLQRKVVGLGRRLMIVLPRPSYVEYAV